MKKTNKSLSSIQENYKTSYSYEIKILREKVLYWKRTAEMHHLEGIHILASLYERYIKDAQEELSAILQQEKELEEANILECAKPKKFFVAETKCSMYQPVLSSFEILNKNKKEVEVYRNATA